jgi:hypothetical protein
MCSMLIRQMHKRNDGSGGREYPGPRIGTVRHNRAKPRRPSTPFVSRRACSSHSGFRCRPPSAATSAAAPCSPIQHRPGLVLPSFHEVTPSDSVDAPSRPVPSSIRLARAATTSLLGRRMRWPPRNEYIQLGLVHKHRLPHFHLPGVAK